MAYFLGTAAVAARLVVVALAMQVGGPAQAYPAECKCPEAVAQRVGILAAYVVRECSKANGNWKDCKVNVTVTTDDAGKCTAALPYCVMCVITKDAGKTARKAQPKLVWTLVDGQGRPTTAYKFDVNKGIDIPDAGVGGNDHFDKQGQDGSKQKFKWVAGPDPTAAGLNHWPVVYPAAGGASCTPIDPIAVNYDN